MRLSTADVVFKNMVRALQKDTKPKPKRGGRQKNQHLIVEERRQIIKDNFEHGKTFKVACLEKLFGLQKNATKVMINFFIKEGLIKEVIPRGHYTAAIYALVEK
jgi:hypothetical protein